LRLYVSLARGEAVLWKVKPRARRRGFPE
jgi:hypothetical protein